MIKRNTALIIDDHPLVLEGVRKIFAGIECIEQVDTANSYADAITKITLQTYDLYIVDLELPDSDGFAVIESIRERGLEGSIIVNTMHDELWTVKRLLLMNVDGIMYKSADVKQIKQAVHAVLRGEQFYCRHFSSMCKRIMNKSLGANQPFEISQKEIDLLHLIAEGYNSNEIAQQMNISVNTVETHRRRLFHKLDAKNMAEMMVKAIRLGLLPIKETKSDGTS